MMKRLQKIIDLVVVYDTMIGVYNTFLCDAQFRLKCARPQQ